MSDCEALRKKYDDLAAQIEREDLLVDKRVTWFLVSEGFLLAAIAQALTKALDIATGKAESAAWAAIAFGFASVLFLVGAGVAAWAWGAISSALKQLWYLKREFSNDPALAALVGQAGGNDAPRPRWVLPFLADKVDFSANESGWRETGFGSGFIERFTRLMTYVCVSGAVVSALLAVVTGSGIRVGDARADDRSAPTVAAPAQGRSCPCSDAQPCPSGVPAPHIVVEGASIHISERELPAKSAQRAYGSPRAAVADAGLECRCFSDASADAK